MRATSVEWPPSRLGARIDDLSDAAVISLAAWTILSWLIALFGWSVQPFAEVWLVASATGSAAWVTRGFWIDRIVPAEPSRWTGPAEPAPGRSRRSLAFAGVSVGCGIAAAIAGASRSGAAFEALWVLAVGALVLAAWVLLGRRPRATPGPPPDPAATSDPPAARWSSAGSALRADLTALAAAITCTVMAVFVFRVNDDDVYYINRAQWIAQFNRIPHRDVLLSNQNYPATAGTGSPVESFTVLQGAMARLFDVHAASVAYLILPPIFAFLAVWALWRLIRCWAPRRPVISLLLGMGFLFVNTASVDAYGMYFFPRFSLGKAVFVSWLVPTVFLLVTRWARAPRGSGWLIPVAAIAGLGLTTSATFVAPLLLLTGALPLVMGRRWRALVPIAVGIAVVMSVGYVGSRFAPPAGFQLRNFRPPDANYHAFLGAGAVAVVAGVGVWLAVWLVRDKAAQLVVLGIVVITAVVLAPHLTQTLANSVGVAGALKRLMWVAPVPAFVGLLATVPPAWLPLGPAHRRLAPALAAAVVAIAALAFAAGSNGRTIVTLGAQRLVDHPTWKAPMGVITAAEKAIRPLPPGSHVLAPVWVMHGLSLITGSDKAINPRPLYATIIAQPKSAMLARTRLTRFERGRLALTPAELAWSLGELHVDSACFNGKQQSERTEIAGLGWGRSYRAGPLTCYLRPGLSS